MEQALYLNYLGSNVSLLVDQDVDREIDLVYPCARLCFLGTWWVWCVPFLSLTHFVSALYSQIQDPLPCIIFSGLFRKSRLSSICHRRSRTLPSRCLLLKNEFLWPISHKHFSIQFVFNLINCSVIQMQLLHNDSDD